VVSGEGVVKLLSVPKLGNSQAVTTAAVIYDTIQDWNIADRIKDFPLTPLLSTPGEWVAFVSFWSKNWMVDEYYSWPAGIMFSNLFWKPCTRLPRMRHQKARTLSSSSHSRSSGPT
jgi:hypothetical protein